MGKRRRVYDRIEKKFITGRLPAKKAMDLRDLMNQLNPVKREEIPWAWEINNWTLKRYKVK